MADTTQLVAALLAVLFVLFIYFLFYGEHLTEPWFMNQMSMDYSDPVYFNYLGRSERDVEGNSMHDYYLQNQIDSATGVLPQIFNDDKFYNQDNYMDMPIKYRPLRNTSAAAIQKISEIEGNNMEENFYYDLNKTGSF